MCRNATPCQGHDSASRAILSATPSILGDEYRRYRTGRFAHHPHAADITLSDHVRRRASEPLANQSLAAPPLGGLALIGDHSFSTGRRIATTTDIQEIRFDPG